MSLMSPAAASAAAVITLHVLLALAAAAAAATAVDTRSCCCCCCSIEDIAAGPSAWSGAENLFATCARSGDVKLWDCRCRGGAAAITLINGSTEPLSALALASNSSSSSNQLGSGMICFAGGANEAVTCWDVRASQAQALYHLSTGNLMVNSLAWHEGSSSLIAACESKTENRRVDLSEAEAS